MSHKILHGDCLEVLKTSPDTSVQCCVTSPPYWGLRDYGVTGQLGLEKTPEEYVAKLVQIFREVKRVLKNDGTLWLNLGDSYNGTGKKNGQTDASLKQKTNRGAVIQDAKNTDSLKSKDLVGIPWRVAFALQADGWYLRQDIIWHKPNPMPESVKDRCTKAHEYIFLLSKSKNYYFDSDAISEPINQKYRPGITKKRGSTPLTAMKKDQSNSGGYTPNKNGMRNKRSVWTITTKPFKGAHFATFPQDLIEPCILAGCPKGGVILDPFFGAGTVGVVSKKHRRNFIGIELNPEYIKIAQNRIQAIEINSIIQKQTDIAGDFTFEP